MEIRKYCEILEIEEQMKWLKPLTRKEFSKMVAEEKNYIKEIETEHIKESPVYRPAPF
jgi:hypothetical protein